MAHSILLRFFDYVRFSQVYCSVDPQKYLTSHFFCLYLVLWVFHVQVKWFWCTHTTRESQVCQNKFLARLCHFFTPGLIFSCPIYWWDIFLSALWGYGCAAHRRCVLSFQVVFVFFQCPVTFSSDSIIGCSTSWGRLLSITIFFSFRIEGRQTTRTQKNSKDQFGMKLHALWFVLWTIIGLAMRSFQSQVAAIERMKQNLWGPLHTTSSCRIMLIKNSAIRPNPTKTVKSWLKLGSLTKI